MFLGEIGDYVLYFLQSFYFYIVGILILYGIFLALSTYNFKRIERRINIEIVNQAKKVFARKPGISYVSLVEEIDIPWIKLVYQRSFFPYVSQDADLWVKRTVASTIRKMIIVNNNKIKSILAKNGILFDEKEDEARENIYLDYVQRLTDRRD